MSEPSILDALVGLARVEARLGQLEGEVRDLKRMISSAIARIIWPILSAFFGALIAVAMTKLGILG